MTPFTRDDLTPRQREIYEFIRSYVAQTGYAPSVREICKAVKIRSPNGVLAHLRVLEQKRLIEREPRKSRSIRLREDPPVTPRLPLAGVIAAGTPVEAVEDMDTVDFSDLFNQPDVFVLRVRGDSMIEDQIADGDYVVVRRQPMARNGQVVVALVDGQDATLKRFYRERNRVRLEPANAQMEPIVCHARDVQILGVVVGVIRRYE